MRIDGTNRLAPRDLTDSASAAKAPKTGLADATAAGPELCRSAESFAKQALAVDDVNKQAVAEAKELIRSGKLDTPEAIRRTAQAILDQAS